MNLTSSQENALKTLAASLGAPLEALRALIAFESGWKPEARNPFTGARGLIQFMPSTAQSLGYKDADDLIKKHKTIESQLLGPVYKYLVQYKPFLTDQSLFMAVFYPAARNWPSNKEFSPLVQSVNPGIKTPADYVNFVYRRITPAGAIEKKSFLPIALIMAVTMYYFLTKSKII